MLTEIWPIHPTSFGEGGGALDLAAVGTDLLSTMAPSPEISDFPNWKKLTQINAN